MYSSTLISTLAFFATTGLGGYVLEDDYFQLGFLDQFSFFSGTDTNQGFVEYQSRDAANSTDLIQQNDTGIYLKVDSTNVTPNGRPSIKLTSNKSYQSGLIVASIAHMPGGICGTWPAFWTVGPNWPNGGEIDILEGVNDQTSNNVTLHTGSSCTITNSNNFTGTMSTTFCGPTVENSGCQISSAHDTSYGAGFNAAGGGIWAMEWTSSVINVFFFTNANKTVIPGDVLGSSPSPSAWGQPLASFYGGFDMATAFVNQQLIINTNFCGTWAGGAWSKSSCSHSYATCEDYVANNPSAFQDAYWQFQALKIYQDDGDASAVSSSSASGSAYSSTSAAAPSTSASVNSPTSAIAPATSAAASSSTSVAAPATSASAPSSTPDVASSSYAAPSSSDSAPAYSSAPTSISVNSAAAASSYAAPLSSAGALSSYTAPDSAVTIMSTCFATETSIVYVTPPAAQPTTFAVSASAPAGSANGYAPVVGGDGGVGQGAFAAGATQTSGGMWSTGADGDAVYDGKKRDEEEVKGRRVRHLRAHRRQDVRV